MPTDTFPVAAETEDGTGYRSASAWADIASGTFTAEETTNPWVSKVWNNPGYAVDNAYFRFDTSTIPVGSTITSARLLIYLVSKGGDGNNLDYAADFYDFGGEPSVAGDWEQSSSGNAIATIDATSLTASQVNTIDLTGLSGINPGGTTGIRIAPKDTTEPTFSTNNLEIAGYEAAQQEPRLEVTYDLPAGQTLLPSADSVDGTWTDQASGTSLYAAISDASDGTYIKSVDSPSSAGCRVKVQAGDDPGVHTGHVLHWKIGRDTTNQTINMTIVLRQGGGDSLGGGTQIATFTRNGVPTGLTAYSENLTEGEAANITNYADLYLEFYASAA